jgi:hypothetical protein
MSVILGLLNWWFAKGVFVLCHQLYVDLLHHRTISDCLLLPHIVHSETFSLTVFFEDTYVNTAPRPRTLKFKIFNCPNISNFFSFGIVTVIFIMIADVYIHIQNPVCISKDLLFSFFKFWATHIV